LSWVPIRGKDFLTVRSRGALGEKGKNRVAPAALTRPARATIWRKDRRVRALRGFIELFMVRGSFFVLSQGLKGTLRGVNKQGATNEKYSIRCDITKSNQRITLLLLSIYSVKVDLMMIPAKAWAR
jgi:hypothetical protein